MVQYAPDTYSVFTNNLRNTVLHFLSCGRFVTGAAAYFAMGILKLGNKGTYLLSYTFAIVGMIISLYRLNGLIKKDIKNDIVSIVISTLIIINPFSIELFMYIEKGIMVLSVLLCVLAVEQIDKFFQGNKKSILWALLFMLIANCCYQGTVGIFVAISLIYIIKYSKNVKEFLVNNVIVALTYGIPAVINFMAIRFLYANQRVNGNIMLLESIQKVIAGTKTMIYNTYGLLPRGLFIVAIFVLVVAIIYKAIRKQSKPTEKVLEILGVVYLICGTLFATIAPQMMQDTNSIWFVARSTYSMAAIVGLLALYLFMRYELTNLERNSIVVLAIIFLIVQFSFFMRYTIDNYVGNYMDKTITLKINDMIQEYEKETGNVVDTISIYKDSELQYVYPELKASGDMNIRAYSADWCVPYILRLYTGRDFKIIENNQKLAESFSQNNWNSFDEDQVIFQDNVMHLCTY